MYAALIIGREAGIIPWNEKRSRAALAKTYRSAMSDPNRVAPVAELVERLRATLGQAGRTLQATAAGRVEDGLKGDWLAVQGLAYKTAPILGLREASLRSSFPNAVEFERLVAELTARGWLTPDKGKERWQPRLKQGAVKLKPRLMRVSRQLIA
jgi:hypothetical protein